MEETKSKDLDNKNNGGNQTRNTVSLWIRLGLGLLFLLKIRGRGFPPCFRFMFPLWNSSVSLSSMKLECETVDFQLKLDSPSLDFKEQN